MEMENGVANTVQSDGDQNDKKRPLAGEDEHDAKRTKTTLDRNNGAGVKNDVPGTGAETELKVEGGSKVENEVKVGESEIKPLSKGTAPVKQE